MLRPLAAVSRIALLTIIIVGPTADSVAAPIVVPVSSTFDSNLDGWTGANPGEVSFSSSGGNPGGFLRFTDNSPAAGNLIAPSKFLGDWSALDGIGSILFDHRVITSGGHIATVNRAIFLAGPGGAAEWTGPLPCTGQNCNTPWETFTAPVDASSWTVTSGSWTGLLADVASLAIRGDHWNSQSSNDSSGFDNIRLVPEPSAGLLVIAGLLGLAGWRRASA